jgi:hypothetical protein
MYAAGHPPIPSIELQTYCAEMPQHWQTPSQLHESLGADDGDPYFQTNYPGVLEKEGPGRTFWNTRKLLIGALTARKKTLDLIVESATAKRWADYSLYDCTACHHELKTESRRQKREEQGVPGRPRQLEWPNSQLYHIGLQFAKAEPNVRPLESELNARYSDTPFGDAARTAAAAMTLRAQVTAAIDSAESMPIGEEIAMGVLRGLAKTPASRLLTYDSARQVVWAMRVIADEMEAEGTPLNPALRKLIAGLNEPKIAPASIGLATKLPAGRQQFIYPDGLRADLERRDKFNPDELIERLVEINAFLVAGVPKRSKRLVSQPDR